MALRVARPNVPEGGEPWFPETEADREAIRRQLGRILASDLFANSKRYPSLLKYIVEETLAGRAAALKERTLGVEVFGRDPSYDTNTDPVVRTSAVQVRHRVAQYYGEPGHEAEVRIELLPGSYVPQFGRAGEGQEPGTATAAGEPGRPRKRGRLKWPAVAAAAAVVLAAAGVFAVARWTASDAVTEFWGPVWDTSSPIVICVPGNTPAPENPTQTSGVALPNRTPATPLSIADSLGLNSITWPDATVLSSVVGFIQAHGKAYRVRRERELPFSDLRAGPALMIGGPYNNRWLARLTNRYRFTYQGAHGEYWISDSKDPSRKIWKVDENLPYSSFDEDYGIISRVWDPTTEQWVVVASGIASYGTIAAGEFLTNARHLDMLAEQAPGGWERKNLQVVFRTKVFNGNTGPPQILAVHVW